MQVVKTGFERFQLVTGASDGLIRLRLAQIMAAMTSKTRKILVVDDDPEIRRMVSSLLAREGWETAEAGDGEALDGCLARFEPDLVVLDLMLPGEDGLSICRRLRAERALPILMLTAKGDEMDQIVGLELGADDYVAKPFSPRLFVARVRALLRRGETKTARPANRRYAFDRFVIDLDARMLADEDGGSVMLTSAEFDLLACFVLHPRRVLSRDQILDWTHGRSADPYDRTVDITVSRLRKELEQQSPGNRLISTVRNGGYLLTAAVRTVA